MKSLRLFALALALTLTPTTAFAEDSAAQVVVIFEGLAQIAVDNGKNCDTMGDSLNAYLDENSELLRDASYSDSVATPEQETAIMNAATTLGDSAGVCYESESVATFFDRFVTLASELDSGS